MAAPRQMTSETLNPLKGWGADLHIVDFEAKLDPAITERVPPGACVSLNADLNFVLGVGNVFAMPMFNFQASDAPDVSNDGGDAATDAGVYVPISPTGVMSALVSAGAYELTSTNFNTARDYPPNTPLTSPRTTGGGVNRGMLTVGVHKTNTICGVVSRGVVDNGYGFDAVAFWPVFLPAH